MPNRCLVRARHPESARRAPRRVPATAVAELRGGLALDPWETRTRASTRGARNEAAVSRSRARRAPGSPDPQGPGFFVLRGARAAASAGCTPLRRPRPRLDFVVSASMAVANCSANSEMNATGSTSQARQTHTSSRRSTRRSPVSIRQTKECSRSRRSANSRIVKPACSRARASFCVTRAYRGCVLDFSTAASCVRPRFGRKMRPDPSNDRVRSVVLAARPGDQRCNGSLRGYRDCCERWA